MDYPLHEDLLPVSDDPQTEQEDNQSDTARANPLSRTPTVSFRNAPVILSGPSPSGSSPSPSNAVPRRSSIRKPKNQPKNQPKTPATAREADGSTSTSTGTGTGTSTHIASPLREVLMASPLSSSAEGSRLARSKTMPTKASVTAVSAVGSSSSGGGMGGEDGASEMTEMTELSEGRTAATAAASQSTNTALSNSTGHPSSAEDTPAQGVAAPGDLRRNKSMPYRALQTLQRGYAGSATSNHATTTTPTLMRTLSFAQRSVRPLQPYATLSYPVDNCRPSTPSAVATSATTITASTAAAGAATTHTTDARVALGEEEQILPSGPNGPNRPVPTQLSLLTQSAGMSSSPASPISMSATPLMASAPHHSEYQEMRGMHITAVNYVTPLDRHPPPLHDSPQKHLPVLPSSTASPLQRKASIAASLAHLPSAVHERYRRTMHDSFKLRAFGRKAISFQQRQWFTNICCVSLCPLLMVMVSLVLKLTISSLSNDSSDNYQILYCSSALSINEQNWPIFNLSGIGIAVSNPATVPNALPGLPVRNANYFSRASLVDLASKNVFSQLSSTTVAGSVPCVNWFGGQYPQNDASVYERIPRTSTHPNYAFKDSLYVSELNSGWLDVLQPILTGSDAGRQAQALSLARSFALFQMRPWAVVSVGNNVDPSSIGTSPKQPLLSTLAQIPNVFFTPAGSANGMLDTIEPRYAVDISLSPPGFGGAQKVPYFNFTSSPNQAEMDTYFFNSIQQAITNLAQVDSSALQGSPSDIQMALLLGTLNKAFSVVPYAGIAFNTVNHADKNYAYVLQVGRDNRLDQTPGFPLAGLRTLLQQAQLSNSILRFSSSQLQSTVITQGLRNFPFIAKPSFDIPFGSIIGRILYPLGISFLLPIFTISLVRDKELRIVTMMRMNGLGSPAAYYVSEYFTFLFTFMVSTVIFWVSGYLTSLELFSKTDPILLAILFFLWGNTQVTLALFFNSLYRQSRIALIGVFLIVVCGVVTAFILDHVFTGSGTYPTILFVWPPFAFYRALGNLNNAATSSQLMPYTLSKLRPGDEVFAALCALFVEIFIYLGLSVYLGNVIPSEFGSNLPWHYPITSLIGSSKKKKSLSEPNLSSPRNDADFAIAENDDVRLERIRVLQRDYSPKAPLVMRNMSKQYINELGQKKLAVNDITFAVDNGTVFGLLGPNGAGKTSLISILTGVYEPTQGEATLGGYDIVAESNAAFRSIGVCPQFDILWPDLTVEEHLFFYARLKGVAQEFEREAVAAAMELVKLETMGTRCSTHLSGGEKRRLSIAIALVADPRVVFLDEPTTGLDPEVRRTVWDVIARARGNRGILMTTHSMEEAEVCCQRIGIMAKGTLRCVGSASSLKENYGSGYKLYVYGEFQHLENAERFLHTLLPAGRLERIQLFNNVRAYVFRPQGQELAHVFDVLARDHARYGIQSWGISQTTLDEIFTTLISEDDAS
ncbi:hypothetical protein BASA83_009390 [Batrachochytrium salamandrivorans]|nr:hypothetical protein BASA83_009390 [Batrachochytrium salamandrivorans]